MFRNWCNLYASMAYRWWPGNRCSPFYLIMSVHLLHQYICTSVHLVPFHWNFSTQSFRSKKQQKQAKSNRNQCTSAAQGNVYLLAHSLAPVHWTNKRWKHIPDVTYQWTTTNAAHMTHANKRTNETKNSAKKNALEGTKNNTHKRQGTEWVCEREKSFRKR